MAKLSESYPEMVERTATLASLFCAVYEEQHRHRSRTFVPPRVPSAILDDNIALFEMNGLSVIEFEPYLAVDDDGVIHCICFMHSWIVFLEVISKSPQTIQGFATGGLSIKRW